MCIYVCVCLNAHTCTMCVHRLEKRFQILLELVLQATVSGHLGAVNETQILWKKNKCS